MLIDRHSAAMVFRLASASAWNRRGTLGLMLVSVSFAVLLVLGIEQVRSAARQSFTHSMAGTDLVAGPRTGALPLILYAVFRIGDATHNMRWSSYLAIKKHPAVAWAIPLSLGDSHRGFAVVGTTSDFFDHFKYGDGQRLKLRQGTPFSGQAEGLFDAVIGSEVAAKLGYSLGSALNLQHGVGIQHGHEEEVHEGWHEAVGAAEHSDKPFKVAGILEPTGTPVDRSVHIGLQAMEAIHLDWAAGRPVPGLAIPAAQVQKFDLSPKEITAVLIGLRNRSQVFMVQQFINGYEGEPLLAALPGVALAELWEIVHVLEKTLLLVSALVMVVSLAGLVAVLLAGMNERRRELAILRSVGAGPAWIFSLLTLEASLVVALGIAMGYAALVGAAWLAAPSLKAQLAIVLPAWHLNQTSALMLAALFAAGVIASLIPGHRAYRLALIDGLTPRL